jgi:nucleotide-binding universal stress UspA family protein
MQKKIFVPVDDSRHSKHAVQYAVQVSEFVPDLHYVLFHVQPMISLFLQDEAKKNLKTKMEVDRLQKKNEAVARRLLEDLRDDMVRSGIDAERIETATRQRQLGLAKDILEYSQENRYDAIVIGRRGLTRLQEMVMGSASANIIEHSQVVPVWLVDGDVTDKRLMAAIDGSEASLRAVDHLSFMLSGNPDMHLTLFHVSSRARDYCEIDFDEEPSEELEEIVRRDDKACIDQFYAHALQKFKNSGISEDRLDITTIKGGGNTGKAILEAAEKGNFGTVVIGRRGIAKAFFMGRVSRYIITRASNRAIWLVP